MAIKRKTHSNIQEASQDIVGLDDTKEEKVTFANRVPNSGDKGRFWLNQDGGAGSRLYFRHPLTGTWTVV